MDVARADRHVAEMDVDLGFAGRLGDASPSLAAIAELRPDDALHLRPHGDRWLPTDAERRVVGRMAKRFRPRDGLRFVRGEVSAPVERLAEDGAEAFRASLNRERWEVVVPELVFEAAMP